MSNKERFEICCSPQPVYTGQLVLELEHWQNWTEEPVCIHAIPGHASNRANPKLFSRKLIGKGLRLMFTTWELPTVNLPLFQEGFSRRL